MNLEWAIALYIPIWWTVLFAILPWGVKSHYEAGVEVPGGGDPASPVDPNLKSKFLTATWVSLIVFALGWAVFHFGLLPTPTLPATPGRFY